jgi:hypothetical protein
VLVVNTTVAAPPMIDIATDLHATTTTTTTTTSSFRPQPPLTTINSRQCPFRSINRPLSKQ